MVDGSIRNHCYCQFLEEGKVVFSLTSGNWSYFDLQGFALKTDWYIKLSHSKSNPKTLGSTDTTGKQMGEGKKAEKGPKKEILNGY